LPFNVVVKVRFNLPEEIIEEKKPEAVAVDPKKKK
jgi:hypothetical protein